MKEEEEEKFSTRGGDGGRKKKLTRIHSKNWKVGFVRNNHS